MILGKLSDIELLMSYIFHEHLHIELPVVDYPIALIFFYEQSTVEPTGTLFLLFLKRSSDGKFPDLWEFPGGKRDGDWTIGDTVTREVVEETGLILDAGLLQSLQDKLKIQLVNTIYDTQKQQILVSQPFAYHNSVTQLPPVTLSNEHQDYLYLRFDSPDHLHFGSALSVYRYTVEGTLRASITPPQKADRYEAELLKFTPIVSDLLHNISGH